MAKPFDERLKTALASDTTTVENLETLIAEVRDEQARKSAQATQAAADSVNFQLGAAERDEAAKEAEQARRDADGLEIALDTLNEKLTAKRENANRKAKQEERQAIIDRRDALAERLRSEWPLLEECAVELLSAIRASDAEMKAAGIYEASAEAVARDCPGNFSNGPQNIRRLVDIRLPAFANGAALAWPASSDAIALSMTGMDRSGASAFQRQTEARERAKDREAASYRKFRISSPPRHLCTSINVEAKSDASEPATTTVRLNNDREIATDKPSVYELWLAPRTVERLRGLSWTVEQLEEPVGAE